MRQSTPRHRFASRQAPSLRHNSARGFTLIEVIVIVLIAAFLGLLTVQMLGTGFLRSFTPVAAARDSAQAEATVETVIGFYVGHVNANTSGTLDAVKAQFPNNATLTITDTTVDGVAGILVTSTVGGQSVTTLLTQARLNTADTVVKY